MNERAWKGPLPRPSPLEAIADGIEVLLSWRFGLGILFVLYLYLEASTPVLRQTVRGPNRVKVTRARGDLKHLENQVRLFLAEQRRHPKLLAELVDRPADSKDWPESGYLEKLPKDPWGGDYSLVISSNHPEDFDVVSLGADNQPGGEDFDADLHSGREPR